MRLGDMLDIGLTIDLKEISIIIKDFTKTYIQNSGCKGVIIGLSGGVDSAVTAVLCKDCLLYTSPSPRDRQKSRMPSSA